MFGGRCAYCGEVLGPRWHADHIEPVIRLTTYVSGKGFVPSGEVEHPSRNCFYNFYPACAPCNVDKHRMSLEEWRKKLARGPEVLASHQPTFRHSVRFGLVEVTTKPVVFYFEKVAAERK